MDWQCIKPIMKIQISAKRKHFNIILWHLNMLLEEGIDTKINALIWFHRIKKRI